jgi:hypothetical protein
LVIINHPPEHKREKIINWLPTTDPSPKHNSSWKDHTPETSRWILQQPEFHQWRSTDPSTRFLHIHGIPGCGKTTLASFIIEQVKDFCRDTCNNDRSVGWAFYYCHQKTQQDSIPFLRWTVSQLCRRSKFVPPEVESLYDQGCEPSIDELLRALAAVLQAFAMVFIMLDAIDESQEYQDLLVVLKDLLTEARFNKVQLLATARDHHDIRASFDSLGVSISMSNMHVERDIRQTISSKLQNDIKLQRWKSSFSAIEDELAKRAQGMYRLPICQLDLLKKLPPHADLVSELRKLPRGLRKTYDRIFLEIPVKSSNFARQALAWLCGQGEIGGTESERGVAVRILLAASTQDVASCQGAPWQSADISDMDAAIGYLLETMGCLVAVRFGERRYGWRFVHLAHYTVKEYLYGLLPDEDSSVKSELLFYRVNPKSALLAYVRDMFKLASYAPPLEEFDFKSRLPRSPSLQAHRLCSSWFWARNLRFVPDEAELLLEVCEFLGSRLRWPDGARRPIALTKKPSDHDILLDLLTVPYLRLAESFLQNKDARVLFTHQFYQQCRSIWYLRGSLRGSILEHLFLLSRWEPFQRVMRNFKEWSEGALDVDKMFLFLVGSERMGTARREWGSRMKALVDMGASIDGRRYAFTPFQIAILSKDQYLVDFLLHIGASSTALGSRGGEELPCPSRWVCRTGDGQLTPKELVSRYWPRTGEAEDENVVFHGRVIWGGFFRGHKRWSFQGPMDVVECWTCGRMLSPGEHRCLLEPLN